MPQYSIRDPLIVEIGAALDPELASPNPSPRIYAGSLAVALTAQFLTRYGDPASVRPRGASLNSVQVRRTVEFMPDNLRRAMGIAPQRYLMGLRVAKARELLSLGNLSIKDIAARVGYADRSHFTDQFLRMVGTTPARYRRELTSIA